MNNDVKNNIVVIAPETYSGAIKPPNANAREMHLLEGAAFATNWRIILYSLPGLDEQKLRNEVEGILNLIDVEMSPFRDDSFISGLNNAAAGSSMKMPSDFQFVLMGALKIAEMTNGCFDPCLWDIVQEWGFGAKKVLNDGPTEYVITRLKSVPKWQEVKIENDIITKSPNQSFDLCAIAKGYAVDKVTEALARNPQIGAALVEIGGELKGFGLKPDNMPWWVDIERMGTPVRVALYNIAIATSGDTYRGFEIDGKAYSHTMNPQNNAPADTNISSVSVIDKFAWRADAIATALMVMGASDALKFADANNIPCVMRLNDGKQVSSKIFNEWCD